MTRTTISTDATGESRWPWLAETGEVATRLQRVLRKLVELIPGRPGRTVEIARVLGVDKTLASKLRQAVGEIDPFSTAGRLPGRNGMEQLFSAAARLGVSESVVKEARAAYESYRTVVGKYARNEQELGSILCRVDPELQRTADLRARAAHHRASAHLFGGYAETLSLVQIARPNEQDPSQGDGVIIQAYFRFRRLRDMLPLVFESEGRDTAGEQGPYLTLDGRPLRIDRRETIIRELCSQPVPESEIIRTGARLVHAYQGKGLPPNEAVDIVAGYRVENVLRNSTSSEAGQDRLGFVLTSPAKLLVWDVFVHREMWPGCVPQLKIFRDCIRSKSINPLERWFDEVSHDESIVHLGPGAPSVHVAQCPRHTKLVDFAFAKTGWSRNEFAGYRLSIRYPVVEREIVLVFQWR